MVELISVREEGDQIKMRVRVSDDVYNELLGIQGDSTGLQK